MIILQLLVHCHCCRAHLHHNEQEICQQRILEQGVNQTVHVRSAAWNNLVEVLQNITPDVLDEDQVDDKEGQGEEEGDTSYEADPPSQG